MESPNRMTQSAEKSAQLGKHDWLEAATQALIQGGVEQVQITALARQLNITRGSFYWHFENREALLDAVIDHWQSRNTGVILEALSTPQSLDQGLLALFAVWVDRQQFDPLLDQAVRDWGRRSDKVKHVLQAEDDARVNAIARFLTRFGFTADQGFIRARVIYFTQLSFYALGVNDPYANRLRYLDTYFQCFIGRDAEPAAKNAFAAQQLELKQ